MSLYIGLKPTQNNYSEFSLLMFYDTNRDVVGNSVVAKIIDHQNISNNKEKEKSYSYCMPLTAHDSMK